MQDDFLHLLLHALLIRDKLGGMYTLATGYKFRYEYCTKKKSKPIMCAPPLEFPIPRSHGAWEIFAGFFPIAGMCKFVMD